MNVTEFTVAEMHHSLIGKPVVVGVYETDADETWYATVTGVLVLHSQTPNDGGAFIFEGTSTPLAYNNDQTFLISYSTEDK